MKRINFLAFISGLMALFFVSCSDPEPVLPELPFHVKPPGVFVVNEGNFTFGNASLTYFNTQNNSVVQDMFYVVNGVPLGDVANFMEIKNNVGFIVVNNSGVIYLIDTETGVFKGKIDGLVSPRELAFLDNGKMIVTDLAEPYLTVINEHQGARPYNKINLNGYTSESIKIVRDKIYVNSWSAMYQEKKNNQVLVVDALSLDLIDSIRVVMEPNSMAVDKDRNLWVLCSGGYMHEERAALIKIETTTDSVTMVYEFPENMDYPTELHINALGDELYYLNKDVYALSVSADSLPSEPLIFSGEKTFYALGVDPQTNYIFVSDALDYMKRGKVYIYDAQGNFLKDFGAGIVPGYFAFYH